MFARVSAYHADEDSDETDGGLPGHDRPAPGRSRVFRMPTSWSTRTRDGRSR